MFAAIGSFHLIYSAECIKSCVNLFVPMNFDYIYIHYSYSVFDIIFGDILTQRKIKY